MVQAQHGRLAQGQEPLAMGRDRYTVRCVQMNDRSGIRAAHMDSAMDGETGGVDPMYATALHDIAILIDLHQGGGGDFVEQEPIGVDQEVMLWAGDPGGQVGEYQVVPTKVSDQPVGSGQVLANLPFLFF